MVYNYCFKLPRKKHQCYSFRFIHLSFLLVSSQELFYTHMFLILPEFPLDVLLIL